MKLSKTSMKVISRDDFAKMKYVPKTKEELLDLCDDLSVNLGEIDTSLITDMGYLFYFQTKRTDYSGIETWDVSNVTDMNRMFWYVKEFNSDISKWDVSNVRNMDAMFFCAKSFNADLSKWDVSRVRDMEAMFYGAESFNADLSKWDVSKVTNMHAMFYGALSFNQDLSGWRLDCIKDKKMIFKGSPLEKLVKTTQWDWSKYHETKQLR